MIICCTSNEHKYKYDNNFKETFNSMINESNICHLISGQHRQHITNYVILHVFQQQRYMISALQEHVRQPVRYRRR